MSADVITIPGRIGDNGAILVASAVIVSVGRASRTRSATIAVAVSVLFMFAFPKCQRLPDRQDGERTKSDLYR